MSLRQKVGGWSPIVEGMTINAARIGVSFRVHRAIPFAAMASEGEPGRRSQCEMYE
jgi:hypothetical protein